MQTLTIELVILTTSVETLLMQKDIIAVLLH